MADDVGIWNLSCYHRGMMGGSTPNINRIAKEGALFTDYYGQQSCTAGRPAFILGQTPLRTGLLKVGMPAAKQGLQDGDPTVAELLKPLGFATAQIGKNHLGDPNEYLPTVHGFDEFYGILYNLNTMEDPCDSGRSLRQRVPEDPGLHDKFAPRNVIETFATEVNDPTEERSTGAACPTSGCSSRPASRSSPSVNFRGVLIDRHRHLVDLRQADRNKGISERCRAGR
jgi:arylsulfatase A-like enzyme